MLIYVNKIHTYKIEKYKNYRTYIPADKCDDKRIFEH